MELYFLKEISPSRHWYQIGTFTLAQIRRVTNTNLLFWINLPKPCWNNSFKAPDKICSFYDLTPILLQLSKWFDPKFVDKNLSAEFLVPHLQFSNNLFHFFFSFSRTSMEESSHSTPSPMSSAASSQDSLHR